MKTQDTSPMPIAVRRIANSFSRSGTGKPQTIVQDGVVAPNGMTLDRSGRLVVGAAMRAPVGSKVRSLRTSAER